MKCGYGKIGGLRGMGRGKEIHVARIALVILSVGGRGRAREPRPYGVIGRADEGSLTVRLMEYGGNGPGVGFFPELSILAIYLFHIGLKPLECFQASIFVLKPLNQVEGIRIRIFKSKFYRDSAILRPDMYNCLNIDNLACRVELMRQVRVVRSRCRAGVRYGAFVLRDSRLIQLSRNEGYRQSGKDCSGMGGNRGQESFHGFVTGSFIWIGFGAEKRGLPHYGVF